MPELPEIEALVDHLRRHAVGSTVGRIDVVALSALKTFDPPITALHGQAVTGAQRWGKYLGLQAGPLFLIAHLSRAGWLRWSDKLAAAPLRPGKGPIALRVHLGTPGDAPGFERFQAVDAFYQGALAGARGSAYHHDLATRDGGAAIGQHLGGAVGFGKVFDDDHNA